MKIGKGNFIWAIGGKNEFGKVLDDVTVYNIDENRWYSSINSELKEMPYGVQGAGWTLFKNKIYSFGGKTKFHSGCSKYVQEYDIKLNKWRLLPSLSKPRSKLSKFIPVIDNRFVYLFGGDCSKGAFNRVNWNWQFDLEKKKWNVNVANAPYSQSFPVATFHKGWIYYITGNTKKGTFNNYRGALNQRYNPKEDRWEVMTPCPVPTTDGAGDKCKNEFHYIGGWNTNPKYYNALKRNYKGNIKRLHLVYNYDTDSWRFEKKIAMKWHHGGCLAGKNHLWLFLGIIDQDISFSNRILRYYNAKAKMLQHTNKIFFWNGKNWKEMRPAPVRKMNFGTIFSNIGPV
jgi:hypothetical protein